MTIKEIIQKLRTTMDDARGQDSHFESWLTQNEGICDAIDMLKALAKQEQGEPVAYSATSDERLMEMPKQEQGEADELLRYIGLDPQTYRTDGGVINRMKVKAALAHPDEYPRINEPVAKRKPLTLGQKQRLWSSVGNKLTLKDRVNSYGLAIEAAHGIGVRHE